MTYRSLRKHSKTLALILCAFLLLTLLPGCGETKSKTSVVLGITQEPGIFDPHKPIAAGDKEILFNVYEGLVRCTAEGEFVPCLATDYEISADALTYTFTLRENVTFHNGKKMTAEDVQYSLHRMSGAIADTKALRTMENIGNVTIDDGKVVVTLREADPDMLPFFSHAIIPENHGDLNKTPVGTGPFVWKSYTPGQSVILDKNPDYWVANVPRLEQVTFKITANAEAAFLELKAGSIDIFPYLPIDNIEPLEDQYNILNGPANMVEIFALNNARAPFDNAQVREALNFAVNREEIVRQTTVGNEVLMSGMSSVMGDFFNEDLNGTFTHDPEKAKALLAEAGYPDGFSSTITVPAGYTIHVTTALILKEQLKQVGIEMEIVPIDFATWITDAYNGRDYDTTVIALTSEFHPADVLNRYVSTAENNFVNYVNLNFDRDFAAVRSEMNRENRVTLYRTLQQYLVEDAASVYLHDPNNTVAVKKGLSGYQVFPMYVQDMSTVYWE